MNVIAFLFSELSFVWAAILWLRGETRKARRALALAVVLLFVVFWLSGCSLFNKPHVVVKPETVEVPKYLRAPLPTELTAQCTYAEPDPACWRDDHREFCNQQLLDMRLAYRKTLALCNTDKQAAHDSGPSGQ